MNLSHIKSYKDPRLSMEDCEVGKMYWYALVGAENEWRLCVLINGLKYLVDRDGKQKAAEGDSTRHYIDCNDIIELWNDGVGVSR